VGQEQLAEAHTSGNSKVYNMSFIFRVYFTTLFWQIDCLFSRDLNNIEKDEYNDE